MYGESPSRMGRAKLVVNRRKLCTKVFKPRQSVCHPSSPTCKLTFGDGICRVWAIPIPFEIASELDARIEFRLEQVVFIEEQDDVDILQNGRADHVAERS